MFNTTTIMSLLTPQLALSFGLSLSLAVTVGCAVGIHQNTITNTLLDWFIFAFLSTFSTCLLTGTCPSHPASSTEEPQEETHVQVSGPVPFYHLFNREFFIHVGVLVLAGAILQATGLVNLLVALYAQYVVPPGTHNVLGQGRDAFMEAVHYVTNVFSSNEVEVVDVE